MATIFITPTDNGFELEDDNGNHYGIEDALKDAIKSAKDMIEINYMDITEYTIND